MLVFGLFNQKITFFACPFMIWNNNESSIDHLANMWHGDIILGNGLIKNALNLKILGFYMKP